MWEDYFHGHFLKQKYDNLKNILEKHFKNTVFDIFVMEGFMKFSSQTKFGSLLDFQQKGVRKTTYVTSFIQKDLMPMSYCRISTKRKSLETIPKTSFKRLTNFDFIPGNVKTQVRNHIFQQSKKWNFVSLRWTRFKNSFFERPGTWLLIQILKEF